MVQSDFFTYTGSMVCSNVLYILFTLHPHFFRPPGGQGLHVAYLTTPFLRRCIDWIITYSSGRSPFKPEERLIKRLIAVGGDWVRPQEGDKYATLRVPKGHCWVEGDNYGVSEDSNHFGPVSSICQHYNLMIFRLRLRPETLG